MKRWNRRILELGLALCILFCCLMYLVVYKISLSFVRWNPELAFMQMPLYVLSVLIITSVVIALVLALILVHRSTKENLFQPFTVKMLYWISRALGFTFLASLAFFAYGYYHLKGEIGLPGGFIGVFVLISFVGTNILYFLAGLFQEAVGYKEENQLTV